MRWIVVRTHPTQERLAAQHARRQGHDIYLPIYFSRSLARRMVLFPSYLFVRIAEQWHHLRSTRGIVGPLTMGGNPSIVRDTVIDDLRSRENSNGNIELPTNSFALGDRLLVRRGALAGQIVLFDGMSSRDRVYVLLSLLGAQRRSVLDLDAVAAA